LWNKRFQLAPRALIALHALNMLQHVFESARRLGMPVIVTDPSGRDPMVVLPLDQFEAMTEGGAPTQKVSLPKSVPEPVKTTPFPPLVEEISPAAPENAEMSLDERFYLEPVEDEPTA
jgi:hypothetical protein